MDKVKVGFIGCGGIAQYHFGHFEKMREKAQIVATCDILEERAQAAAGRFQANAYLDYQEMLAKEQLDALFICVQPGAHDGMELLAIEKGIPLFVQKPMTLKMAYAKKVQAALKKKQLPSAVGLQCRYCEGVDIARRWADSHDIGVISGHRLGGMPKVWWWRIMEQSGGQAVEQTIHDFDLLRYIFGEVASVRAVRRRGLMTHVENYNVDDASSSVFTFKSGAIGTFSTGCFGSGAHDINAYAPEGSLSYSIFGNYKISEPNRTIEGKSSNDYGQECTETFIDVVSGALPVDEVLSPYADAMKTLALVFAINSSMDNDGAPVTL
jgi:myo-inositol 2-dehydrogenase/D-chiro-inositol 1-dehydrogenase